MPGTMASSTAVTPSVNVASCSLYAVDRASYCSSHTDNPAAATVSQSDACMYPLKDYACSMASISPNIAAAALTCALTNSTTKATQSDYVVLISSRSVDEVRVIVDSVNTMISGVNITDQGKQYMLKAIWQNIYNQPMLLTEGFLASYFQQRCYRYMPAINDDMLSCLTNLGMPCAGVNTMLIALDAVYMDMQNSTRSMCANWIQRTLTQLGGCGRLTMSQWISSNWKSFKNQASYPMYLEAWSGFNASSDFLALTAPQLAQCVIMSGYLMSESDSWRIIQALNMSEATFCLSFLDEMYSQSQALPVMPVYSREVLHLILEVTLDKVVANYPNVCVTSMKDLFQLHLRFVLREIDNTTLALIPSNIGCSDFQDICGGLDSVFDVISPAQRLNVRDWKMQYLKNQTNKDGSPCLFLNTTSDMWLMKNLGRYRILFSLSEILTLNPRFMPMDATDMLSPWQLAELVVYWGILTNDTVPDAEFKMFAILAACNKMSFVAFTEFMVHLQLLTTQAKIKVIVAVSIRSKMMATFWTILVGQFYYFNSTDYDMWLDRMSLFTASITSNQLNQIPPIQDCTTLRTCSSGFSRSFGSMTEDTQQAVANWLVNTANTTVNLTAACPSGDWLNDNFQKFKVRLTVDVILYLNPTFDLLLAVPDLTPSQCGGAVVHIPNSLTDVQTMGKIFVGLTTGKPGEVSLKLAQFWDAFNPAYRLVEINVISPDVQFSMLNWTVGGIAVTFSTMTYFEFNAWWIRLEVVIPAINLIILNQVKMDITCDKAASLVAAVSMRYSDIPDSNTMDVFDYMLRYLSQTGPVGVSCSRGLSTSMWMNTYLGNLSSHATYKQLMTCNPQFDGFLVLSQLTTYQVSYMLLETDALVNMTHAMQIIGYWNQIPLLSLHKLMVNFTIAADLQIQMETPVIISSDVGLLIITNLISMYQLEWKGFKAADWSIIFEKELKYFISYISASSLQLIEPSDCASVMTCLSSLNTAYGQMSSITRGAVVNWLVGVTTKLGGCQGNYTQTEWIHLFWLNFTPDASLQQIKNGYPNFDVAAALPYLPMNCKIEYIMSSDALVNDTTMDAVLNSLQDANGQIPLTTVDDFLTRMNSELKPNFNIVVSVSVKEDIITVMIMALSPNFGMFTTDMYDNYFNDKLRFCLSNIKAESISLLRTDMSCGSLSVVISAFNRTNSGRSDDVKMKFAQFINSSLGYQKGLVGPNGNVCPTLYSTSSGFISTYIMDFDFNFTIELYQMYYTAFDPFSALRQLSTAQIAATFVTSCLRDQLKASQVLIVVQEFTYANTMDFMEEFNMILIQKNIFTLPDAAIQSLLCSVIFPIMVKGLQSADCEMWFGTLLTPVISSITVQNIASLPSNQDCNGQAGTVAGFGKNFDKCSMDQKEAVHTRIKNFLSTQGPTCTAGSNSSEWLRTCYGPFAELSFISEFMQYNPNFKTVDVLEKCSPAQLVEYGVSSGAFNTIQSFSVIVKYVTFTTQAAAFMMKANTIASTQLQNSPIGTEILLSICNVISKDFPTFTQVDWHNWCNVWLINVLQYTNQTFLDAIPTSMDCGSHKEIVMAYDGVFNAMSQGQQMMVYNYCRRFFLAQPNPSGVICGNATMSSQEWMTNNFGRYSIYGSLDDFMIWNKYYVVASSMIEELSDEQLAVYTLRGMVLSDNDLICRVLAKLHKQAPEVLYTYLDQFYSSAMKMNFNGFPNVEIRDKMFVQFFRDIQPAFPTYKSDNWSMLFDRRIALFRDSIDKTSTITLLQSMGCDDLRKLVTFCKPVKFTMDQQTAIAQAITDFLSNQTGACLQSGEEDAKWMRGVYGTFSGNVNYSTLLTLNPKFNGLDLASNLSTMQLAGCMVSGNNLNDPTKAQVVAQALQERSPMDNQMFAKQFNTETTLAGIGSIGSTVVRDLLCSAVCKGVGPSFSTFSSQNWTDFMSSMMLLLPGINAASVALFPNTMPCSSYLPIISACNKASKDMSSDSQAAVCQFATGYLTKKFQDTGSACSQTTPDSSQWILQYLAFCKMSVTYDQMSMLNPYFDPAAAVVEMTPQQRGQFAAEKCLQNPDAMGAVLKACKAEELGSFLDEFNMGVAAQELKKLPNDDVGKVILTSTMCSLGSTLDTETPNNFTDLFGKKLKLCLTYLDATSLGFIPKTISCDSLKAIMGVVGDPLVNLKHPQDCADFSVAVLQQQQKDTGTACVANTTDREYMMSYFGTLSKNLDSDMILSLKSSFTGVECVDILSEATLAGLALKTSISLSSVFDSVTMSQDLQRYKNIMNPIKFMILKEPRFFSLTIKVRFMCQTFFTFIGPKLNMMSVANATELFDICDPILGALNATMLESIPSDISCNTYQVIVSRFNGKYLAYTSKQRAAVLQFFTKYLTQQAEADGSACASGVVNTSDWIQKNLASFCIGADPTVFQKCYDNFSAVSFNAQCTK